MFDDRAGIDIKLSENCGDGLESMCGGSPVVNSGRKLKMVAGTLPEGEGLDRLSLEGTNPPSHHSKKELRLDTTGAGERGITVVRLSHLPFYDWIIIPMPPDLSPYQLS